MAKYNKFATLCPCTAELKGFIKKPTWFIPSFTKIVCQKCGSRFLMSCTRDKDTLNRTFTTDFEILELTPKAERAMSGPKTIVKAVTTGLLEKLGLEEKPYQIQTSMDEHEPG